VVCEASISLELGFSIHGQDSCLCSLYCLNAVDLEVTRFFKKCPRIPSQKPLYRNVQMIFASTKTLLRVLAAVESVLLYYLHPNSSQAQERYARRHAHELNQLKELTN